MASELRGKKGMTHIQADKNFKSEKENVPSVFKFIELGVPGNAMLSSDVHCRGEHVSYL